MGWVLAKVERAGWGRCVQVVLALASRMPEAHELRQAPRESGWLPSATAVAEGALAPAAAAAVSTAAVQATKGWG